MRIVAQSARLLAVHNEGSPLQLREEFGEATIRDIAMGGPGSSRHPAGGHSRGTRFPQCGPVMAFGMVTPEKRIPEAIRVLASILDVVPDACLLLAGEGVGHYDPMSAARALGVSGHVSVAGFVPDEEMADYLDAADVCLCMRWPSSRETSASWLRCLAAGRATITTDLVHLIDVPAFDPRSWTVLHGAADTEGPIEGATVSIDIVDEEHLLKLAMRRLAIDAGFRAHLEESAHRLWLKRFTIERMVADYHQLIEKACGLPAPVSAAPTRLPAHLSSTGSS